MDVAILITHPNIKDTVRAVVSRNVTIIFRLLGIVYVAALGFIDQISRKIIFHGLTLLSGISMAGSLGCGQLMTGMDITRLTFGS
jgi:hypothetical protein